MAEFTFGELALMLWASVATAMALNYRARCRAADVFLQCVLHDKKLRDKMVAEYDEHMKGL